MRCRVAHRKTAAAEEGKAVDGETALPVKSVDGAGDALEQPAV